MPAERRGEGGGALGPGAARDIEHLARLMDDVVRIPGTGVRFGLDALIGLVPVAGDLAGMGISLYLIARAYHLGAPAGLIAKMAANAGLDLAVGSLPLIGDLFDVAWRANRRNVILLKDHLERSAPS